MALSDIFDSPLERAFLHLYRAFFSIREIEERLVLKWVFGATILSYFATFSSWIGSSAMTVDAFREGVYLCQPYFQSCGEWYFLRALPNGYSQTATFVSIKPSANSGIRTVNYRIIAPGGTWEGTDNGVYTVTMQANQVADSNGIVTLEILVPHYTVGDGHVEVNAHTALGQRSLRLDVTRSSAAK